MLYVRLWESHLVVRLHSRQIRHWSAHWSAVTWLATTAWCQVIWVQLFTAERCSLFLLHSDGWDAITKYFPSMITLKKKQWLKSEGPSIFSPWSGAVTSRGHRAVQEEGMLRDFLPMKRVLAELENHSSTSRVDKKSGCTVSVHLFSPCY